MTPSPEVSKTNLVVAGHAEIPRVKQDLHCKPRPDALADWHDSAKWDCGMNGPQYLIPECVAHADGMGPLSDVGANRGKLLVLTLGINCIVEKESLVVSIWGSADKIIWGAVPLASFTQKYYCGTYSILLNLAKHPNVQYVRAEWKMSRWGREPGRPMFAFYVSSQPSGARLSVRAAATA